MPVMWGSRRYGGRRGGVQSESGGSCSSLKKQNPIRGVTFSESLQVELIKQGNNKHFGHQ